MLCTVCLWWVTRGLPCKVVEVLCMASIWLMPLSYYNTTVQNSDVVVMKALDFHDAEVLSDNEAGVLPCDIIAKVKLLVA